MKKQISRALNGAFSNRFRTFLALLLLLVSTTALQAQTVKTDSTASTPAAIVKHVGNVGNSMVFQVHYVNPTGEKFSLVIKDKDGVTLFQETYREKLFDKKFHLPRNEYDQLNFIIRASKNNTIVQSFQVNTSTRIEDEVVVKKQG